MPKQPKPHNSAQKDQTEKPPFDPPRRLGRAPARLIQALWRRWVEIALSALSGLALAAGFPTLNWWPTAFFALAPFLWSMRRMRGAGAFGLGLWFGLVFNYAAIFWLNSVWIFNYWAPVGIVLLALYLALYCGLFAWWGSWLWRRKPAAAVLALPGLWIFFEWFHSVGQLAFPWVFLAHTQAANLLYIQLADLGGTGIISFCLAAINVLLVELFDAWRGRRQTGEGSKTASGPIWPRIAGLALLAAGPYAYGASQLARHWSAGPSIQVGVSQPNVEQIYKLASYALPDEADRHRLQTEIERNQIGQVREIHEAAPGTQLYILPETSFTEGHFPKNARLRGVLGELAREVGGSILFGEDNEVWDRKAGRDRLYVSAWMATPERGVLDTVYNKMRLVPFGESLPYFRAIPFLQDQILGMGLFDRGSQYTLFECGGMRFGCGICFESAAARHVAQFVRAGAQFLVIITNDAWYYHRYWHFDPRGAAQHDSFSTFRAIETRRWIVRSANTGISRIIEPSGRTVKRLGLAERGSLTGRIEGRDGQTLYVRFGDWFVALSASFTALAACASVRRRPATLGRGGTGGDGVSR